MNQLWRKRGGVCFLLCCLILSLLFPLAGCGPQADQVIAFDLSSAPDTLDPQITSNSASGLVLSNVMEGLTVLDETGKVLSSSLVERQECSTDQTIYRFLLKKDLTWSDGRPLTADDFVFAFQRIFQAETLSPGVNQFSFLKNAKEVLAGRLAPQQLGVFVDKDGWLTFLLTEAREEFLKLLSEPAALPCNREFFEETKGKYGIEREKMIYNGPFVVQYWLDNSYVHLLRNPRYSGTPALPKRVLLSVIPSESERLERFLEETTIATASDLSDAGKLPQQNYQTLSFEGETWCLVFRLNHPILSDKTLRQALVHCFSKEQIPSTNLSHRPTDHLLPPVISQNRPAPLPYSYDPAGARALFTRWLTEHQMDKLVGLTLLTPNWGAHRSLVGGLQQEWQSNLSLFINLDLQSEEEYWDKLDSGEFDLALVPLSADYNQPSAIFDQFSADSNKNYPKFQNKEFDRLLKQAISANDAQKTALYQSCYQLLKEEFCLVPLYTGPSFYLVHQKVSGFSPSPFGDRILFANVIYQ